MVQHAETNAREALERRLAESTGTMKLLEGVATLFDLPADAGADRDLRQQPHHGHQRLRRDGGGRTRRVHEKRLSQIQHPRADYAGR